MPRLAPALTSFILCLWALAAVAHEVTVGDLTIQHPAIPAPLATAKAAAGYMAIVNAGATDDRLIAVEMPVARHAMLHQTVHAADGMASMQHLAAVDIPAGETVRLHPGGMHVMLMGLTAPLTEGQRVPATLVFERAGRIAVEFVVDPANGTDHSDMGH